MSLSSGIFLQSSIHLPAKLQHLCSDYVTLPQNVTVYILIPPTDRLIFSSFFFSAHAGISFALTTPYEKIQDFDAIKSEWKFKNQSSLLSQWILSAFPLLYCSLMAIHSSTIRWLMGPGSGMRFFSTRCRFCSWILEYTGCIGRSTVRFYSHGRIRSITGTQN